MAARETVFSDAQLLELLKTKFVPLSQSVHEKRDPDEVDWFNKVRKALYNVCTPEGERLGNVYGFKAEEVKQMMIRTLAAFQQRLAGGYVPKLDPSVPTYTPYSWPEGSRAVEVRVKFLVDYDESKSGCRAYYGCPGLSYMVLDREEVQGLARGMVTEPLKRKIAINLRDTREGSALKRGWEQEAVKKVEMTLSQGQIRGSVHLQYADKKGEDKGYVAEMLGFVEAKAGKLTRFDLVIKGEAWDSYPNRSKNTNYYIPEGKFTAAFAFKLLESEEDLARIPLNERPRAK